MRPSPRWSLTLLATDLGDADQVIPLPNVTANVLKKVCGKYCIGCSLGRLSNIFPKYPFMQVLEYCDHHQTEPLPTGDEPSADESRKRTTDIGEWDQKFISVDQEMLFEIILAANYLDIKPLL